MSKPLRQLHLAVGFRPRRQSGIGRLVGRGGDNDEIAVRYPFKKFAHPPRLRIEQLGQVDHQSARRISKSVGERISNGEGDPQGPGAGSGLPTTTATLIDGFLSVGVNEDGPLTLPVTGQLLGTALKHPPRRERAASPDEGQAYWPGATVRVRPAFVGEAPHC
jgi:hypothetical protein